MLGSNEGKVLQQGKPRGSNRHQLQVGQRMVSAAAHLAAAAAAKVGLDLAERCISLCLGGEAGSVCPAVRFGKSCLYLSQRG